MPGGFITTFHVGVVFYIAPSPVLGGFITTFHVGVVFYIAPSPVLGGFITTFHVGTPSLRAKRGNLNHNLKSEI